MTIRKSYPTASRRNQVVYKSTSRIALSRMRLKKLGTPLLLAALMGTYIACGSVSQAAVLVSGDLDVDNYSQLFTGNAAGTSLTLIGGVNTGPNSVQNYSFSTTDQYLYVAAWSDDGTQQGLLHDLAMNSIPRWSGHPAWEVYATGDDLDSSAGPSSAQLSTQIATANASAGGAGTSVTWVAPTVGGINNGTFPSGNPWVQQATIATNANWTWYDSGNQSSSLAPFRFGFDHDEYLIFRTPIIIPEPSSLALMGIASLFGLVRFR